MEKFESLILDKIQILAFKIWLKFKFCLFEIGQNQFLVSLEGLKIHKNQLLAPV